MAWREPFLAFGSRTGSALLIFLTDQVSRHSTSWLSGQLPWLLGKHAEGVPFRICSSATLPGQGEPPTISGRLLTTPSAPATWHCAGMPVKTLEEQTPTTAQKWRPVNSEKRIEDSDLVWSPLSVPSDVIFVDPFSLLMLNPVTPS